MKLRNAKYLCGFFETIRGASMEMFIAPVLH